MRNEKIQSLNTVEAMLANNGITGVYLSLMLWGKNTATTRSKLSKRRRGIVRWTEAELQRLEEIRVGLVGGKMKFPKPK